MSGFDTDTIIVGAGVIGLATGLALAHKGVSPIILEKAAQIGEGVSSRNSEVIHGGLYYPTGSLKARLCVEGRRLLYAFLDQHRIAHQRCGKLVVAVDETETARMDAILTQALTNGVEGMEQLSAAQVKSLEPDLRTIGALYSPTSGVFDSHGYMVALQGRVEDAGGAVVLNTPFLRADCLPAGGFRVHAGGAEPVQLTSRRLIIASSLHASDCADAIDGFPKALIPKIHYGKGNYFALRGKAPFRHLVYPLPIKGALGTHYRQDLGGQGRFGPDLHFVDALDYDVETDRLDDFYTSIRRYWPGLEDGRLTPDYTGIRPKIHGPGEPQPDFRIDGPEEHGVEGLITMFGIESPGLTSSLAIGQEATRRLGL